ncbi:MAG: calcium-binding protein [Pseudomonadota bacterium]
MKQTVLGMTAGQNYELSFDLAINYGQDGDRGAVRVELIDWWTGDVFYSNEVELYKADGVVSPSIIFPAASTRTIVKFTHTDGELVDIDLDNVRLVQATRQADYLSGERGDDTYVFSADSGETYIYDDFGGTDTLRLEEYQFSGANLTWTAEQLADGLLFTFSDKPGVDLYIEDALIDSSGNNVLDRFDLDVIEYFEFKDGTTISLDELLAQITGQGTSAGETIYGSDSDDILEGKGGNDTLIGREGDDRIDGGEGTSDTAVFSGMYEDYTFVLYQDGSMKVIDNVGSDGTDTVLSNVEYLQFADDINGGIDTKSFSEVAKDADRVIYGTDLREELVGAGGNDTIDGLAGPDTLIGGAGNDRLIGGESTGFFPSFSPNLFDPDQLPTGSWVTFEQEISGMTVGGNYQLSFDAFAQTGGNDDHVNMFVFVRDALGNLLESVNVSSLRPSQQPREIALTFAATTSELTVYFATVGSSGGATPGIENVYLVAETLAPDHLHGEAGDDTYVFNDDSDNTVIEDNGDGNDTLKLEGYSTTGLGESWDFREDGYDLVFSFSDKENVDLVLKNALFDSNGDGVLDHLDEDVIEEFYFDDSTLTLDELRGPSIVMGTDTSETLQGSARKDIMYGDAGNDILEGGEGNDELNGGGDGPMGHSADFSPSLSLDMGNDFNFMGSWTTSAMLRLIVGETYQISFDIRQEGDPSPFNVGVWVFDTHNGVYVGKNFGAIDGGALEAEFEFEATHANPQLFIFRDTDGVSVENVQLLAEAALPDELFGGLGDDTYVFDQESGNTIIEDNGGGNDTLRLSEYLSTDRGNTWDVSAEGDDLVFTFTDKPGKQLIVRDAFVDSNNDGVLDSLDDDVIENYQFNDQTLALDDFSLMATI